MRIERKVHAINEVERIAAIAHKSVVDKLATHKDKKIFKNNGTLRAAYQFEIESQDPTPYNGPGAFDTEYASKHSTYMRPMGDSLYLYISMAFKDDEHTCFYQKKTLWVCDMKDNRITNLATPYKASTYDAKEQEELLKRRDELEHGLRTINSMIVVE